MEIPIHKEWHSVEGFESLFKDSYEMLCKYAYSFTENKMIAEEVAQEVFLKLWQQREQIHIETNLKSYLFRAVHNQCLNILNHEKIKRKHQKYIQHQGEPTVESGVQQLVANELKNKISMAIHKIPEKCYAVFHLSRHEGLSYQQIATQLNISIKTVENHISKALKILRVELKEYLPIIICIMFL